MRGWPTLVRRSYVLLVLVFGWMIFRAQSMAQVESFAGAMLGEEGLSNPLHSLRVYADSLTWIASGFGVIMSFPSSLGFKINRWNLSGTRTHAAVGTAAVYGVLLVICMAVIVGQTHHAVIYFRF